MARRTWVLDTDTKGTGANMVPLEKVLRRPEQPAEEPARPPKAAARPVDGAPAERRERGPGRPAEKIASPLPPGHVRKRSTGEIGKVQAVDARAGTATVHWFKRGSVSTVPLSAVSRR
jgi:hypothetical protein